MISRWTAKLEFTKRPTGIGSISPIFSGCRVFRVTLKMEPNQTSFHLHCLNGGQRGIGYKLRRRYGLWAFVVLTRKNWWLVPAGTTHCRPPPGNELVCTDVQCCKSVDCSKVY